MTLDKAALGESNGMQKSHKPSCGTKHGKYTTQTVGESKCPDCHRSLEIKGDTDGEGDWWVVDCNTPFCNSRGVSRKVSRSREDAIEEFFTASRADAIEAQSTNGRESGPIGSEPCAWGEFDGDQCVTASPIRGRHCVEPLYPASSFTLLGEEGKRLNRFILVFWEWAIGISTLGDLEDLEKRCKCAGVNLSDFRLFPQSKKLK